MQKIIAKIPKKIKRVPEPIKGIRIISRSRFLINSLVGIALYTLAFFIAYYIKRKTIIIDVEYYEVYLIIILSIVLGAIFSNKISIDPRNDFNIIFRKNYISLIFSLGSLSILFLIFNIDFTSRFLLLSTFILGFLFETSYHILVSDKIKKTNFIHYTRPSLNYFILDWLILTIVNVIKLALPFRLLLDDRRHLAALAIGYLSWAFSGAITHKFNPTENSRNKWHGFSLQIKFYLLNLSLLAIAIYVLQISSKYTAYFLESALIYSGLSFVYFIYVFAERIRNKTDEPIVSFLKTYELKTVEESTFTQVEGKYRINGDTNYESNLRQSLQFDYLKGYPSVFLFLDRKIDLKSIDAKKSLIIRSTDTYNIKVLPNNSFQFIVNLHELNDFRRINDYLQLVNEKLIKGGLIVGCLIHNNQRYQRFIKKYSFIIGNVFYFFDFVIKRVVPKLPVLRNFYFKFTKGKDRAISLTEALGRLVFCGFEILDITEINNTIYFACVKSRLPINESKHSYSTIFKMKRIGKNGKEIFVYKLRTMHPYAEFLQEFVYKNNKLQIGGKFRDDFRIPVWGKVLRQLWIDELPMIINFLKGDLKLVGVRPLSKQYLSLYSKKHQKFREKFKPGLIPPFYADMPKTINEIELSEAKYLRAYQQRPFTTDFIYLISALNNIIFKKKRSA